MIKRAAAVPFLDIKEKIRALPRQLNVGDFFSGAGTFWHLTQAAFIAIHRAFPSEARELEAGM